MHTPSRGLAAWFRGLGEQTLTFTELWRWALYRCPSTISDFGHRVFNTVDSKLKYSGTRVMFHPNLVILTASLGRFSITRLFTPEKEASPGSKWES